MLSMFGCPPNSLLSDLEQHVDAEKSPQTVATPVFDPSAPGGTYSSPTDLTGASAVTITCSTPGATIYYTDDGLTPSVSTTPYTGPLSVSGDQKRVTIKAVGVASGMTDSELAQQVYFINYDHYSVYYDGNGNTGGEAPADPTAYVSGQQVTVLDKGTLVRLGWLFTGWNTAPDGSGSAYGAGAHFDIGSADVKLYAQWRLVELTASDGAAGDQFGDGVAASGDGGTILVGADQKTVGSNADQGAAYVFTGSGSSWAQLGLAASGGAANDRFGYSVAVSGDGNTLVVGADGGGSTQGAAYVFTKSGGAWTQAPKLTASDGVESDYFGCSVALSSDGSTLLVGATDGGGGHYFYGAAYVFTKSGSTWSQVQRLTITSGVNGDFFGWSVAVSGDGGTLIIGAGNKKIGSNSSQGAAYVFTKSGSTWSETQEITASDGAKSDNFGSSVAISSDGNTFVVGAKSKTIGTGSYQGAVYVFEKSGSTWSEVQKLTASDGTGGDGFGISVAGSGDCGTLLIGAYNKTIGGNADQGAAYVFTKSGPTWVQAQELTGSDGADGDLFGRSVAASADGSTLVVGAAGKTISGNESRGAAYVFTKSENGWVQQ